MWKNWNPARVITNDACTVHRNSSQVVQWGRHVVPTSRIQQDLVKLYYLRRQRWSEGNNINTNPNTGYLLIQKQRACCVCTNLSLVMLYLMKSTKRVADDWLRRPSLPKHRPTSTFVAVIFYYQFLYLRWLSYSL